MKERPMLFNGDMVRAILDGRKTQTRRVMKPQPEPCDYVDEHGKPRGGHSWPSNIFQTMLHVEEELQNGKGDWVGLVGDACPFGDIGDRLWVRETFMDLTGTGIEAITGQFEGYTYRADTTPYGDEVRKEYKLKWTPSLHMPRKACRLVLEITAVRVERLNDISEEDAKAEGVGSATWFAANGVPEDKWESLGEHEALQPSHINRFATLWESIYGAESWQANPWVWVIEFKRVEAR
ncbi:hypothetical protein [Serratia sp. JSRIV004]|uniref:hypothetical protein n=1 Tax=Serratia sp. JSRIV004 TaxID=2831895 RepID=UPI001CBEF7ED|nr:hypothetical protein [Serratia sp. JSRIV004]UAN58976.1 hypothetical protein KGP21_07990 [Serratia sp. JSRIV004]UAN59605.1 hypothetical protein KGP21_11375 [Serratia sp. JSRIV004]